MYNEKIEFELENNFDLNTKIVRIDLDKLKDNKTIFKINFSYKDQIFIFEIEIEKVNMEKAKYKVKGNFVDINFDNYIQCENNITKKEELYNYFIHDNYIYTVINLTKIGEAILSYNPNKTYRFFEDRIDFSYYL